MERVNWLLEGVGSALPAMAGGLLFLAFGLAVVRLFGVRAILLNVAVALPVGIALLALTSEVLGLLGVHSSLALGALAAVLVAALVAVVRRSLGRGVDVSPEDGAPGLVPWAGAVAGAVLGIGTWVAAIGDFRLPPQANDDIWHGYLVERLTQMPAITASTVAPTLADSAQPVWHYPYGLHLAEALVRQVTTFSVPEVLNGAWLVYVGALLPFGLVALAWQLWPGRPWVAFWTGVMSSAVTVYPFLTNGVFPYTVALAMVPGFLALLLAYLRQPGMPGPVVALSAVGIFVTHPLAAVVAAALAAPLAVEEVVRRRPDLRLAASARRLAVVAVLAIAGSLPWLLVSEPAVVLTPVTTVDLLAAVSMFVSLASPWSPPQYQLAILVAAGVLATIVARRGLGLAIGFLAFGGLYVADLAALPITATVTGVFLGWYRLLAVVGLILPILAGLGVASIVAAAGWLLDRAARPWTRRALQVVALAVGVLVSVTTLYGVTRGLGIVRTAWHSGLVTSRDVNLLGELADRLGPADRVLNSPRDGSSWMFALYHAVPVVPYVTPQHVVPGSVDWSILYGGGDVTAGLGATCRRLEASDATYAIVKNVAGDVGDFDIAGFLSRNSSLFTLIERTDSGAIYSVNRDAVKQCAEP